MAEFGGWDLLLWAVAAYLAVATLVRLMRARRDQVVASLQQQVAHAQQQERRQRRQRERREQQRRKRERIGVRPASTGPATAPAAEQQAEPAETEQLEPT